MLISWLFLSLAQMPDAGPSIEPPTAACEAPKYPESLRRSGIRGTVVLKVTLAADGSVSASAVSTSLSATFDEAALTSLAGCHFQAAKLDGVATPSLVELSLEFIPPVLPWVLEGKVVGDLGVALLGARVAFGGQQTLTDQAGHFMLEFDAVPAGDAWVLVEQDGYALKGFPEVFKPGETTSVRYELVKQRGFETRIEGSRLLPPVPDADRTPQVSHFTLTGADIDRTPGALEDISRVVMQLPGVAGDPDLLANFFVRGGAPSETIFYLDGIPLANPYHLGGFASIFNPMLISGAEFYAGASPGKYEPSLSGVLEVNYAVGDGTRPRAQADVSLETAKARVDTPLGIEGLTLVASFRRSYFEAYFAILKALGVVGSSVVAPDITEGMARLAYKRGAHQTVLTFIHASDGFDLIVKPGEEVLVNFAGNLKLLNSTQILSLKHTVDLPGDSQLSAQVGYIRDTNTFDIASQKSFGNDAFRQELLTRADLVLAHSETNRTSAGAQYSWRQLSLTGEITDVRAVAPWAQQPIVDAGRANLSLSPRLTSNLLALYGDHTWRPTPRLSIEGGGRLQFDASDEQFSGSARLAAAYTLPTLTTLKLSGGAVWQPVQSVLALDPTVGNPHLVPERALQLIGGLEQPLPFEALLRLEGWGKWMSSLVVNPDSQAGLDARLAAGQAAYTNGGFGKAWGVDGLLVGRTRHFSYSVSAGLVFADRTNPLAEGLQTYPVQWEQRFNASASLSWSPSSVWIFTARANFRTGRPYTPVTGFVADDANQRWLPTFGETDSQTYPFFFEANLRGERRFTVGPLACAVYLELLNVSNTMNVFSYIYGSGDYANGVQPTRGRFNHLPIRPFLGIRAEY